MATSKTENSELWTIQHFTNLDKNILNLEYYTIYIYTYITTAMCVIMYPCMEENKLFYLFILFNSGSGQRFLKVVSSEIDRTKSGINR